MIAFPAVRLMQRCSRYLVGAVAGILDATGNVAIRDRVLAMVPYVASTINGFDATADAIHRLKVWLDRRRF